MCWMLPAMQKASAFVKPWKMQCSRAGGDTERTTDTQAQRDHADVVDGGVREAALDIVLA